MGLLVVFYKHLDSEEYIHIYIYSLRSYKTPAWDI